MYAITIGGLELTILDDGTFPFPATLFFANVAESAWRSELETDANGKIAVSHNCALIKSRNELIVVDTGYGDDTHGGRTGRMLAQFDHSGHRREQVTMVVCTHAHGDHNGRNTIAGRPTFPNAAYFLGRGDWDWFCGQRGEVHHFAQNLGMLADWGMLRLVDGPVQLTPEVSLLPTPGHTPGHVSVMMESGGQTAVFLGDLCHHRLHFSHPDWVSSFDTDPQLTPETREWVFRLAIEKDALVICPHAPYPGLGHVRRTRGGYVWASK